MFTKGIDYDMQMETEIDLHFFDAMNGGRAVHTGTDTASWRVGDDDDAVGYALV